MLLSQASFMFMGGQPCCCMHAVNRLHTPCAPPHLPQTIASPFQLERLLQDLNPVPYIFSRVAAAPDDGQPAASDEAGEIFDAPSPPIAMAPHGPSAAEITERVRTRVQALLGPEVRCLSHWLNSGFSWCIAFEWRRTLHPFYLC